MYTLYHEMIFILEMSLLTAQLIVSSLFGTYIIEAFFIANLYLSNGH